MKLIHFQGLNCYLNCFVSIANEWGVKYPLAFSSLWSETDFTYDATNNVFTSKHFFVNMESLGVKRVPFPASREKWGDELNHLQEGSFISVGMDAFDIPWSPIYAVLHDSHYFIAQRGKAEYFCFDPTYGTQGMTLTAEQILSYARDILQVTGMEATPLFAGASREAWEIINNHPNTLAKVGDEFHAHAHDIVHGSSLMAKYAEAMINNRHLFKRYLALTNSGYDSLFDKTFFARWEAIKNGLYKAALVKKNKSAVVAEVGELLRQVIGDEIEMAKQITLSQL